MDECNDLIPSVCEAMRVPYVPSDDEEERAVVGTAIVGLDKVSE